jgi:hypothetical protein
VSAVDAYLEELVRRLREVLGERLVGAWLLGSGALGDFSVQRSDIDVQAVSRERVPLADRKRLVATLSHEALACPARGLELVLYAREDLGAPEGPAFGLNLNTGARMDRHVAFDPAEDPRFWFVIDVSIAGQRSRALAGPTADAVLPALPRPLVLAALREALEWYEREGPSGAETILAACRSLAWASDGRWRSKADGAEWARAHVPDAGVVERALALRAGAPAPPLTSGDVAGVLDAARAGLRPR